MAYEKKIHQDQAMRSMQLSQQAHTPNMIVTEATSPQQQSSLLEASPRGTIQSKQMQRDTSKGGAMLPPQSPVNATQRSRTPKLGVSAKTPSMTPQALKEELAVRQNKYTSFLNLMIARIARRGYTQKLRTLTK